MNRISQCMLMLVVSWCTSALAVSDAGWIEITPSGGENTSFDATDSGSASRAPGLSGFSGVKGDKLYMVRPGESLLSIARSITGSDDNAFAIAAYNGLADINTMPTGGLLFVPYTLLPGNTRTNNSGSHEIKEIGEFESIMPVLSERARDVDTHSYARKLAKHPVPTAATHPVGPRVATQNIDMFAGEVTVLGKVTVTRVAIGNGAIVRAEVLSSGELLVIAQKAGSTSLRLWHSDKSQSDYNIRVSENDPETRFRMERMVRMKVRLVEFRKSALGRLGIDWSDSTAGPTIASAGDLISNSLYRPAADGFAGGLPNAVKPFSTYFGVASNITSRINFLASSGDAVILAEPVLSCANGGNASFLAGGEVPYPSVGSNGQSVVQFKEYGIKLNISPQIDTAGNVRARVDTEISQIDPAVSVNGAPGLLTRRAQTQVNVRSGETIVISGLLSAENSKDIDSLPGLGKIPVLGALFRSKNLRNSVSELVIFVTPEVIEPAANTLSAASQKIFDESSERVFRARQSLPLME